MRQTAVLFLILTLNVKLVFSQTPPKLFDGIWEFVPLAGSSDSAIKSFQVINKNRLIEVSYWLDTKSASIYGNPFTYYGFWDTFLKEPQPKNISELKQTGKYLLFYDDLIKNETEKNKIGYDSLGNLYKATRQCSWAINDNLPAGLPSKTLSLFFNMEPDFYKKVDEIPDYVLISLKKNKEDWEKYLNFLGHKMLIIRQMKSFIYSLPDKKTKIYLLKNDEVEILEEKDNWLKIRYYGNKTIEGWIKKSDVE